MLTPILIRTLLVLAAGGAAYAVWRWFRETPTRGSPTASLPRPIPVMAQHSKESPTGMRVRYRTKDGQADYGFSLVPGKPGWRVYIDSQPNYQGRDESGVATHRLCDHDQSRYYVCWTHAIPNLNAAKAVAALWADKTQEYIRAGQSF
jgi:hypothetical protein